MNVQAIKAEQKPQDVKKELKTLYALKQTPQRVFVPKAKYLMIKGQGDPNEKDGQYAQAVGLLYGISYTIRMSIKKDWKIPGYVPFVVPPLEGLWWMESVVGVDYAHKENFHWYSIMRLPDFVTEDILNEAKQRYEEKNPKKDTSIVRYVEWEEGDCIQMLHLGPYDAEPATVEKLHAFAQANQLCVNIGETDIHGMLRYHHEIYLSDPRRCAPDKLKTILRLPVKENE